MNYQSIEAQDLGMFNTHPWAWVKKHLDRLRSEDSYDGRFDKFYEANRALMNYQTYLFNIDQEISGLRAPDISLDARYIEVLDRYLDRIAS